MKFTDGMWMTRAGYTVESPGEIYEVKADGEGLTLFCPYVACSTGAIRSTEACLRCG